MTTGVRRAVAAAMASLKDAVDRIAAAAGSDKPNMIHNAKVALGILRDACALPDGAAASARPDEAVVAVVGMAHLAGVQAALLRRD